MKTNWSDLLETVDNDLHADWLTDEEVFSDQESEDFLAAANKACQASKYTLDDCANLRLEVSGRFPLVIRLLDGKNPIHVQTYEEPEEDLPPR